MPPIEEKSIINRKIKNALWKVVFLYNLSYLCAMRKIITYKTYFSDFIKKLSKDEVNKIRRALDLFKIEDKMPRHFIKFIRDGVYETMNLASFSYMTVILLLYFLTHSKRRHRKHRIVRLKRL